MKVSRKQMKNVTGKKYLFSAERYEYEECQQANVLTDHKVVLNFYHMAVRITVYAACC